MPRAGLALLCLPLVAAVPVPKGVREPPAADRLVGAWRRVGRVERWGLPVRVVAP